MKVLSLFSGIGAFEKALDNLEIPYELVGYCEIDKYASKSYAAIHGVDESMNLGDITKIDEKKLPKDIDIITYGFPCQDISLAGKQKGLFNADGTQTRSGLFFEALRIIEETKPKIAIAENVKNLTGKKFKLQFEIVLKMLEAAGYNNYWQVLNAKDYGIPQNRERVFIISIRKDIDTGFFQFPEGFPLELRLKDMLESKVDEKYYLPDEKVNKLITRHSLQVNDLIGGEQKHQSVKKDGISTTLTSSMGTGGGYVPMIVEPFIVRSIGRNPENPSDRTPGVPTVQRLEPNAQGICNTLTTVQKDNYVVEPVRLGNIYGEHCGTGFAGNVWDKEAISPTLMTMQGGNRQPMILVEEPKIKVIGNYSPSGHDASRIVDVEGIAPTVKENHGTVTAVLEPVCLNSKGGRGGVAGLQPSIQDRVYDSNAISTAVTTCFMPSYLVEEPTIQRVDIPQTVSVRKYEVDTEKLVQVLRSHKESSKMTNKTLAEELDLPITKVEHWFRRDDCFAIPDAEVWLKLKELLQIDTDEFDESIMTFEEKEGVYEKSERHYFADGIMPTLTSTSAGNEKIIVREATKQGYAVAEESDSINIGFPNSKTRRGRVGKQIAGTLTTSSEMAVVVAEPINPMPDGTCRTIKNQYQNTAIICTQYTGTYGATMVGERLPDDVEQNEKEQIYEVSDGKVQFIGRDKTEVEYQMPLPNGMWRIRKLTPKECWRLMGFDDEDFEKAEAVNSNTQLYKQAGNSIVVDVIEHLYSELANAQIEGFK